MKTNLESDETCIRNALANRVGGFEDYGVDDSEKIQLTLVIQRVTTYCVHFVIIIYGNGVDNHIKSFLCKFEERRQRWMVLLTLVICK